MQADSRSLIVESAAASLEGRMHFGEVVGLLMRAGVESYHVDYRAGRSTYYFPGGETLTLDDARAPDAVAASFDVDTIRAAVRGAQQGTVMYPEFRRLSQSGGCASYAVWIAGRHVAYYGRKGEVHVERFPD